MSYRGMLRLAGLAAMVGGAIWALASLQQFLNLASPGLLTTDGPSGPRNVVFARYVLQPIGVALLAIGLVGLYARQARATGIPGLIGFLLAFFGTAIVMLATGRFCSPIWAGPCSGPQASKRGSTRA